MKTCAICGHEGVAEEALTCEMCGEGSWLRDSSGTQKLEAPAAKKTAKKSKKKAAKKTATVSSNPVRGDEGAPE